MWLWTLHTKVMDIVGTLLHWHLPTYRLTSHQDSRPHGSIHIWLWIHEICSQNHQTWGLWLWTLHTRVIDILATHLQWSVSAYRSTCQQHSRSHGSIHMWLCTHEICPQNHLKLGSWLGNLHTRVIDILGTPLHWSLPTYRSISHQHRKQYSSIHIWLRLHEICPQNHSFTHLHSHSLTHSQTH